MRHADTDLGLAYIGQTAPTFATLSTNITFTSDSVSTTDQWTIAANSSTVTFNETTVIYIVPSSGSFAQVGFSSSNDSLPTGAVTTGFTWFGNSVAFVGNNSNFELQFWANATTEAGIYALYWNSGGTVISGAFPVTLKRTPPTVLALG